MQYLYVSITTRHKHIEKEFEGEHYIEKQNYINEEGYLNETNRTEQPTSEKITVYNSGAFVSCKYLGSDLSILSLCLRDSTDPRRILQEKRNSCLKIDNKRSI